MLINVSIMHSVFHLSLLLFIWLTGSDQHDVRFWSSNAKLHGGKQVDLPSRLCRQSSDVDRVSSAAGGSSRLGSGLTSGNPDCAVIRQHRTSNLPKGLVSS